VGASFRFEFELKPQRVRLRCHLSCQAKSHFSPSCFLGFITPFADATSDWPQWRGPDRNGALRGGPALTSTWSTDGPPKLWESEPIPSDDDGGHGSVIVAGGRAYLSVVWHRDEPSETRTITDLILRTQLGHQNPASLGKELVAKIEATRESLPPALRGAKLDEFTQKFIGENLDKKQRQLFSGFVSGRFKKGALAIPLGDYDKLQARVEKPFASQIEFEKWSTISFAGHVKAAVLAAVLPSKRGGRHRRLSRCEVRQNALMTWTPGEPRPQLLQHAGVAGACSPSAARTSTPWTRRAENFSGHNRCRRRPPAHRRSRWTARWSSSPASSPHTTRRRENRCGTNPRSPAATPRPARGGRTAEQSSSATVAASSRCGLKTGALWTRRRRRLGFAIAGTARWCSRNASVVRRVSDLGHRRENFGATRPMRSVRSPAR
jgi:hypothetical protein